MEAEQRLLNSSVSRRTAEISLVNPSEVASCGSPSCGGCYEVGTGVRIHPPKTSQVWIDGWGKWQAQWSNLRR